MDKEELSLILDPEKIARAQKENPFVRISEAVYNILEEAILTSELKPGSKIKINKIAEELHVSGTPVREAVEQLTARGLVVESHGAGGKYKNYFVFDIEDEDIAELFVARKSIESTAAYVCAQRNWRVDMPKLEQNLNDFRSAVQAYVNGDTVQLATEYDRRFHTILVEASENRYLIDMYNSLDKSLNYLSTRTCEFMAAAKQRDSLLMLCSQHDAIMHAIKLGFPALARESMDEHIDFCAGSCLKNRAISVTKK